MYYDDEKFVFHLDVDNLEDGVDIVFPLPGDEEDDYDYQDEAFDRKLKARRLIISDILRYNVDFDFPDIVELTDKETGGLAIQAGAARCWCRGGAN